MKQDKEGEVLEKPSYKIVWIYLNGEKLTGVIVPADSDPGKLLDRWKSILAKNHPGKEVTIKEG